MERSTTVRHATGAMRRRANLHRLVAPSRNIAGRALLAALLLLAVLLFWRRLVGGLSEPLSGMILLSVAIGLALACSWLRWLEATKPKLSFRRLAAPLASILVLASITLPGTSLAAACVGWSLLIACESLALSRGIAQEASHSGLGIRGWRVWLDKITRIDSPHPLTPEVPARDGSRLHEGSPGKQPLDATPPAKWLEQEQSGDDADEGLIRQVSRGIDEQGREVVFGWVRLPFATGQRAEVAHVEFCPPFELLPQAVAASAEDPADQVKVAQLMPHGMVLEVRLASRPSEHLRRTITFRVTESVAKPHEN